MPGGAVVQNPGSQLFFTQLDVGAEFFRQLVQRTHIVEGDPDGFLFPGPQHAHDFEIAGSGAYSVPSRLHEAVVFEQTCHKTETQRVLYKPLLINAPLHIGEGGTGRYVEKNGPPNLP
jgi:hypothetical protein